MNKIQEPEPDEISQDNKVTIHYGTKSLLQTSKPCNKPYVTLYEKITILHFYTKWDERSGEGIREYIKYGNGQIDMQSIYAAMWCL